MIKKFKPDTVFSKYQFPNFGELVTLETLLEKLNSAKKTVEDNQTTYYGWWPNVVDEDKHDRLPQPVESYIPEIGEMLFLRTPSFWDFYAGGNMELLRITENTFVVSDVNEERYYKTAPEIE